jgi:hypothetical protein
VIRAEMRQAVLSTFPPGTPLLVLAPDTAEFAAIVRARNDAAIDVRSLCEIAATGDVLHPSVPYVLLEGLDDLDDPHAFLAELRDRAPQARVFALIANGAHLHALGAFFSGVPLAAAHPLVLSDIEPLFRAAGWQPLAIENLIDESIPSSDALPFVAGLGDIEFHVTERAMLERGRNAAFLVVADRT